jgi:hypothetical protein
MEATKEREGKEAERERERRNKIYPSRAHPRDLVPPHYQHYLHHQKLLLYTMRGLSGKALA